MEPKACLAMPPLDAGKELPSRIPTLARLPSVKATPPVTQTTSRSASKSVTSSSPRPPTDKSAPPTSRPASRSVTTRPTNSTAAKPTQAASPASNATPTRPASRSVSKAGTASTNLTPAASASRPASRSASRSVTSSSSTASSSGATPRTKPPASPAARPVSRSVVRPATSAKATPRTSAPSTKATNSPALGSKAAARTPPTATSPLTLAAVINNAVPAPLSLPQQASESAASHEPNPVSILQAADAVSTADTVPADLPPPTDPSVPIYHAPHYRQEVHHTRVRTRSSVIKPVGLAFSSTAEELEAKVNEWREEYLAMSIEEVADWLQRVLGNKPLTEYVSTVGRRESLEKETTEAAHRATRSLSHPLLPPPSPLFDALQTGVLLCQLALAIDTSLSLRYKQTAAVGSFFARDNINSFLDIALSWGVLRSQLFEVDDLVMRKSDRGVVNSLLDITRVVYIRFPHVLPPQLVQFELEIAALEAQPPPPPPPPPKPAQPLPPAPVIEPAEPPKPRGPRYLPYIADETDALDVAVGRIVNGHSLDTLVKRIVKGQYYIAEEKVHHLRLVRHLVLVRVGGGWEGFLPMTSRKIMEGVGENNGIDGGAVTSM